MMRWIILVAVVVAFTLVSSAWAQAPASRPGDASATEEPSPEDVYDELSEAAAKADSGADVPAEKAPQGDRPPTERAPAEGAAEEPPAASPEGGASANRTKVCLDAFVAGQSQRRTGELLSARRSLLACAQETCHPTIRSKCRGWLQEVREAIPTVSVSVIGPQGTPVPDATVTIDGTARPDAATGRAVAVDPGTHLVDVSLSTGESRAELVGVAAGRKNLVVEISFASEVRRGPTILREEATVNVGAIVGFGLGGAGLLAGAILGGLAISDGDDLEQQCATTGCSQREIDRGLSISHGATASFIIAGLGTLTGVIFLVVDDRETQTALTIGPSGLSLRGRF